MYSVPAVDIFDSNLLSRGLVALPERPGLPEAWAEPPGDGAPEAPQVARREIAKIVEVPPAQRVIEATGRPRRGFS